MGFDLSGAAEFINYDKFRKQGYFIPPAHPDWKKPKTISKKTMPRSYMLDFYENPEKNPLKTPSGKIEFYSQYLARNFPGDRERPPVPHWIPYGETHQESLFHPRAKIYPLLCISNHGRWRVHANLDDIDWFHEARTGKVKGPDGYLYEPLWVNPIDAKQRGIKDGDIVKAFNERGGVLFGAYVTERIMPGVVSADHGARYDPIIPGELDRGGAMNTLTPRPTVSKNATGMVCAGYLVNVERINLDELQKKYPEAFNKPYDQASGQKLERVLAGDK